MFTLLGELEDSLKAERYEEGGRSAIVRGVKFDAKRKLTGEQVVEVREKRENDVLIKELASDYGMSNASVYGVIGSYSQ